MQSRIHLRQWAALALAAASFSSCASSNAPPLIPMANRSVAVRAGGPLTSPITHVVIIFQENRSTDFLFQGIRGADIATTAIDANGDKVALKPVSLDTTWDLSHEHDSFVRDYDGGKMDGFDAGMPANIHLRPFGYGVETEVKPYHDMANQYVLADHMFQSNQGPSFPAHLYIVSGTASDKTIRPYKVSANPHDKATGKSVAGGCDTVKTAYVETINPLNAAPGPTPFPCFDRPVLSDYLDSKGVSWRYYQEHRLAGLWYAFDAIRHVRYGPDFANVVSPSATILSDIAAGKLAGVTWVMPAGPWSDHAGRLGSNQGPSWVTAIVNAIGESKYWKNTAIFITWDDWGGWYDHVAPPIDNAYELGFRVPLLVVSPYAKHGYVSKAEHEFGSILAFTEEAFGIPKGVLDTTDVRADDLMDAFDFTQKPRPFVPIAAPPFKPSNNANIPDSD